MCPTSIEFVDAHLAVAEWREARLHAKDVRESSPGPAPTASLAPKAPPTSTALNVVEDAREAARQRLDAAWLDVRAELEIVGFEPYETARLASLLEQASSMLRTDRSRRVIQPLAKRRPLVPAPPKQVASDGTLRFLGRAGRPVAPRPQFDLVSAETLMRELSAAPTATAASATAAPPKRPRGRQAAATQDATQGGASQKRRRASGALPSSQPATAGPERELQATQEL